MNIGILGQGYVGTAIKEGFSDFFTHLNTYDKFFSEKSTVNSLKNLVEKSDIIFVCLPTPMKKTGECDLSIIEEEISKIDSYCIKKKKIVVIKSTIPPGSTERFNKFYQNISVIFNPEFLTEKNFIEDFKNQSKIIIGSENQTSSQALKDIYLRVFNDIPIIIIDSKSAEMIKYIVNTFLATKVTFANEIKILCDEAGIDFREIIKIAMLDKRLGESHWQVPGPDGKSGFGGSCFPKDLKGIIFFAETLGIKMDLLCAVWENNLKFRPDKDWEKLKGRAISN